MVTLESLDLSPDELETHRNAIRRMAYDKWLEAGCPACDGVEFWLQAERDWIERRYVPRREGAGESAPPSAAPAETGDGRSG